MAAMNSMFPSSSRRLSPEKVAGFAAEQARLKADAADRRAAAADRPAGEKAAAQPPVPRRSQYLQ